MTARPFRIAANNGKSGFLRRHRIVLALSTALAVAPASFTTPLFTDAVAAPVVGTSAAVKGDVYVSTQGAERKAQIKDSIKLDDVVTTKQDSALQILLLDESTFTVGQNCAMVIDKFVYDPDVKSGEISATVTKGAFRFMSGNIGKSAPTNASISTPSATIGIRGTFFEGIVGVDALALAQLGGISTAGASQQSASLIILRGPGPNTNSLDRPGLLSISTSGGSTSVSTPNYAVFDAGNGSAPIGPFPVTTQMQEYLDFFLRSSPNGPSEQLLQILDGIDLKPPTNRFGPSQPGPNENPFEDLIDGLQDSLLRDFCTDSYGDSTC